MKLITTPRFNIPIHQVVAIEPVLSAKYERNVNVHCIRITTVNGVFEEAYPDAKSRDRELQRLIDFMAEAKI